MIFQVSYSHLTPAKNFNTVKIIPDSCRECTESNLDRDFETEMVQCQNAVNEALDLIEDSKTAPV